MNKLKPALVVFGGVVASLLVIKLYRTYVHPRVPAPVQKLVNFILP